MPTPVHTPGQIDARGWDPSLYDMWTSCTEVCMRKRKSDVTTSTRITGRVYGTRKPDQPQTRKTAHRGQQSQPEWECKWLTRNDIVWASIIRTISPGLN